MPHSESSGSTVRLRTPSAGLSWLWIIGGALGLLAAVLLLVEKIELLENPDYIPTCNVSPVLSCGSVMVTPQAELFWIPNPIIGIIGFSVVTTIGVLSLSGSRLPNWFRLAMQGGVSFGVVFVHWLIFQSLYVIGALCPYCMIVWAVMIPIFLFTSVDNLRAFTATGEPMEKSIRNIVEYRAAVLTVWFLIVLALIIQRFWDYWSSLI